MPIASIILAGALTIAPKAAVELTVDFSQVTTGVTYKIHIKLFDGIGRQKGATETITLGAAADTDDIVMFFQTAIRNTGLTTTPVASTKKVKITGTAADFKRIEYSTSSPEGRKWVPNADIKGPTVVGKPEARAPSFIVNPKPL
jgi:hypothetical protein